MATYVDGVYQLDILANGFPLTDVELIEVIHDWIRRIDRTTIYTPIEGGSPGKTDPSVLDMMRAMYDTGFSR